MPPKSEPVDGLFGAETLHGGGISRAGWPRLRSA